MRSSRSPNIRWLLEPIEAGASVGNQEPRANGGKAGGALRMVRRPLADQALGVKLAAQP